MAETEAWVRRLEDARRQGDEHVMKALLNEADRLVVLPHKMEQADAYKCFGQASSVNAPLRRLSIGATLQFNCCWQQAVSCYKCFGPCAFLLCNQGRQEKELLASKSIRLGAMSIIIQARRRLLGTANGNAAEIVTQTTVRAVGLEPSGPYERKFVVPTEAERSRIHAPTSGVVNIYMIMG
eukprot:3508185-Pleurochrysis_carterae.AAC.1